MEAMNINRSDGWVKLHKSMLNSSLWQSKNGLFVFTTFLLLAHHKDNMGSVRFKGKQRHLKKGEFAATITELSKYLSIPRSTLRVSLSRLQTDQHIDQQTDNHITVFRICNWEKYQAQDSQPSANQVPTKYQPSANRPLSPKNKEGRIKNTIKSKPDGVQPLYEWYISQFEQNPKLYKLTDKRKQKLKARLSDCGADMIREAIRRTASSSFHRGDNERGWKADLDWIIKSYEQTERLSQMQPKRNNDADFENYKKSRGYA